MSEFSRIELDGTTYEVPIVEGTEHELSLIHI